LQKQTDSRRLQLYAPLMALGDELRRAREAADMTQEQVAVAAKIDRAHLSLLENDHKSPTVDTLVRLCRALGVPPSEILARVERSEQATAE
jgi:transcriptional regulator with XRE-family HTH domain